MEDEIEILRERLENFRKQSEESEDKGQFTKF